jgi:hypothetical protein
MNRHHIIDCHGYLDALGDFAEAILRTWPFRHLSRARRRFARARRWG